MQKELIEFLQRHNKLYPDGLSDNDYFYKIHRHEFEHLDGKIKTEREELLIEYAENIIEYAKEIIVFPANVDKAPILQNIQKQIKELEDAERINE